MDKSARIYVAGHRGLAGSALLRRLQARGYRNLITYSRAALDLTDRAAVRDFFQSERPDYVFLAAAKAGGILANRDQPALFIQQNLFIQTNVIDEAQRAGVKRLLFLAASCIYPRDAAQPIGESSLLTGPLEFTNEPYAVAKIAGVEMCWAYNRQYGTKYLVAVPNNLYGPGDNYDPQNSHVVAGLIRKFHEAKFSRQPSAVSPRHSALSTPHSASGGAGGHPSSLIPHPSRRDDAVVLWGTGTPRRELLYSDDMADACVMLMELPDAQFNDLLGPQSSALSTQHSALGTEQGLSTQHSAPQPPLVNIGCGEDCTIKTLAEKIRDIVGFKGEIEWDASKPDGTPRKLLDSSRITSLGWVPGTSLEAGLRKAYEDFLARRGAA